MSADALRILVLDVNTVRSAILEEGLREAGYDDVIVVRSTDHLMRRIVEADPDVILIDLENPNRDVLEHMFQVSKSLERPIGMFVDQSEPGMIERAVEAGVSTYIVDGLKKERVKPILDMTLSRFNAFNRLRRELEDTRKALEDRKVIDRAKAMLIARRGLTEPDAYKLLRRTAMDENRTIADVAKALTMAASLLETEQ
ncbi:MAG: ANTAR domain-containing response regulator [Acuticoccus sp.]